VADFDTEKLSHRARQCTRCNCDGQVACDRPCNTDTAIHDERRSRDNRVVTNSTIDTPCQQPGYRFRDPLTTGSMHDIAELSAHTSYKCTSCQRERTHQQPCSWLAYTQTRKRPAECHWVSSALSASIPAVSRPLELSLQSSLQLSLTVLVCYRSRGRI
jgi:hypothetical protein